MSCFLLATESFQTNFNETLRKKLDSVLGILLFVITGFPLLKDCESDLLSIQNYIFSFSTGRIS